VDGKFVASWEALLENQPWNAKKVEQRHGGSEQHRVNGTLQLRQSWDTVNPQVWEKNKYVRTAYIAIQFWVAMNVTKYSMTMYDLHDGPMLTAHEFHP
jgi:maltose-binding protein MalE